MTIRVAVIAKGRRGITAAEVAGYLPSNYAVLTETDDQIFIQGSDNAGWTLDDYVIPRLGSGLIFAREITPAQS